VTARDDLAAVLAEVRAIRAELSAMTDVVSIFYGAGRADALGTVRRAPRKRRSGHLRLVRSQPQSGHHASPRRPREGTVSP
jgi:hypothetical protein